MLSSQRTCVCDIRMRQLIIILLQRVKANMEVLKRQRQLLSELDWQLDAKKAERAHPPTMNEVKELFI